MKICMITSVYALSETDRNGSFLVTCNRNLRSRNHEITVLAPSYEGCGSHTVDGVRVRRFRYFFKRWENLTHFEGAPNKIRRPMYLFVAAVYILAGLVAALRLCREEKFDVIHVHWPFPHGIWGYAASRFNRVPMVLTFHGAELNLVRKFPFVRHFLRHAARHASAIICNSTFTAGQVATVTGAKASVIPFGITVGISPTQRNANKAVKDILFVGRLIERKGVNYLLEAMKIVKEKVDCHLHIVGGGDRASEWKTLAEQLDLGALVTFHGVVSNDILEDFYAEADVFVLPSIVDDRGDTEGLGVVLLEALSYQAPVIASRVGGIPDVIIDGETGLLVPERSPKALAEAIARVLLEPELVTKLADGGVRHVQNYFNWDRITDSIETVYRNALGSVPSRPRAVIVGWYRK